MIFQEEISFNLLRDPGCARGKGRKTLRGEAKGGFERGSGVANPEEQHEADTGIRAPSLWDRLGMLEEKVVSRAQSRFPVSARSWTGILHGEVE